MFRHRGATIVHVHFLKRYRSRLPYLIAVGLLALVSACTPAEQRSDPDGQGAAGAPVTEDRGPTGKVPQGLTRYYSQSLTWGQCEPYATSASSQRLFKQEGIQCARLTVPLDYDKPDGETISLGLLRHRATGAPDERIGSLVVNPGGPGASGMVSAASQVSSVKGTRLEKRFDLVGFDPRGVGASRPAVQCLTANERDAERADDAETNGTPAGVAEQQANSREFARNCTERTRYGKRMLANLGTRQVVRDMDVLRSVLGDEKLTYLGYSYGTRLGYTYAETFPDNVRAMVLDGALDPSQGVVDSLVAQGKGFGDAFTRFAEWCARKGNCPLGGDPARATEAYQQLVRPLIQDPISVGSRTLSYQNATMGTIQALYSQKLWPYLQRGLRELAGGKGTTLLTLADAYYQRGPNGEYAGTQDAFTAINCVDDPPVTDKSKLLAAEKRYENVAPFLDDGRPDGAALQPCAYWPVPPTSRPHEPDVEGVPPVLVISTTNDPATPYQAGVELAEAMGGALLTYEGTQHTVFLQGVACVDRAGTEYLVDKTLPPEGKRCSGG